MCVHPLQAAVFLCTILYRVLYFIECRGTELYFKSRMSGSKCKSCGDVAGTVLYISRYHTARLKMFLFFFACFLYIICVKSIINLL